MRRNEQLRVLYAFHLCCLSKMFLNKQNIIHIFFPLLSVSTFCNKLIIVIVIYIFIIVVFIVVVLSSHVFHFLFCLFLQVTQTTKLPLTFTVTIQSHTRPITF